MIPPSPRIVLPNQAAILEAAGLLRAGELVAFPTETVYGLGCDAGNADAVAKLYAAKGRPSNNPLIVHGAVTEDFLRWGVVRVWPAEAQILAAAFWPGPLTLVLPRGQGIVAAVAAGGDSVGVRVPRHSVARDLLLRVDAPIAAPSANRSNAISPSRPGHVAMSLGERVALILDGGPCDVGIESTVLDLRDVDHPRVLRPGMVTAEMVAEVLRRDVAVLGGSVGPGGEAMVSPGQLARHYAPHTATMLASDAGEAALSAVGTTRRAQRVAWLTHSGARKDGVHSWTMPTTPAEYARELYAALHALDKTGADLIVVEPVPETADWDGVRDRLRRACTPA